MAEKNERRSFVYALTAKGRKELVERGGQAKLIFDALKTRPMSQADLVSKLVRRFENKDIAKLNISWYLTKWTRVHKYTTASKPKSTK